ncbi:MAG: hypothetical protein VKK59_05065 [Vampirovibrionales bacterium]|nr:hypothetical protein [Vampirovibrionales bacterium]
MFSLTAALLSVAVGWVLTCSNTWALSGFSPSQYNSATQYGQGVFYAPQALTLFREPSAQSAVEATLTWSTTQSSLSVQLSSEPLPLRAQSVFLAFYPEAGLALLPIISYGDNDWVEVLYRQDRPASEDQATAWVKTMAPADASANVRRAEAASSAYPFWGFSQSWTAFFRLNGRRNGLYWLTGVSGYHQSPRTEPDDKASLVEITAPTKADVKHLRGNWVLMAYHDFGQQQPMGWVRWRDDDGRLMQFVNFSAQPSVLIPPRAH